MTVCVLRHALLASMEIKTLSAQHVVLSVNNALCLPIFAQNAPTPISFCMDLQANVSMLAPTVNSRTKKLSNALAATQIVQHALAPPNA